MNRASVEARKTAAGGDIVWQSTSTEWSVARVVGHLLRIGDAGIIDSELLHLHLGAAGAGAEDIRAYAILTVL